MSTTTPGEVLMSPGSGAGIGVVGLGTWGEIHVRGWQSLPFTSVRAVSSRTPERAREIAEKYGIPRWYATPEELSADPDVDVVSVVNDEHDHLRATLAAVRAGKPVLVEKPIATTLADAQAMVDAANNAGVPFMPGHLLRFDSRLGMLKQRVAHGELGSVASVYARRLIPRDRYTNYQRTHPALNAAVHDIDLALWYAEAPVTAVRAYQRNVQGGEAPDVLCATIEFANGALGVIENIWLVPEQAGVWLDAETEVIGSRGMARVRFPSDAMTLWLDTGAQLPDSTVVVEAHGRMTGALVNQFAYFLSCVSGGSLPEVVTGDDALRCLAVTLAIIDSASTGREVRL